MTARLLILLILLYCSFCMQVLAASDRIVAIGDVHGDFNQFQRLLVALELVDAKGKWTGGETQLIQLGDLPDRGPDTRKVMDWLRKLEKQASRAGGQVDVLIGNHDAMMLIGDLRYVHPGEYAAFKNAQSRQQRDNYYEANVAHIKRTRPKGQWPEFDREYKRQWQEKYPLGYVEHRRAWAPTGKYGKWVLTRDAVLQVGDTLFVHGGLSGKYASMSLIEINTRVRTALLDGEAMPQDTIVEDSQGPLWNRRWASAAETSENFVGLQQVLDHFGVKRMVLGHTPLAPAIIPRFNGKVILADVGLSSHYGNGFAAYEQIGDTAYAWVNGQRIPLPNNEKQMKDYFSQLKTVLKEPGKIDNYLQNNLLKLQPQAENKAMQEVP